MKTTFLALAVLGLLAGGCTSPNINPASAQPHTGYVDFYAVNADDLYWDITDVNRNKKVFYEFNPVKEPILRLAFKPGHYQLRVTFLNHVITKPGVADVEVQDGMVTPVTVTLLPAGTALVKTRSGQWVEPIMDAMVGAPKSATPKPSVTRSALNRNHRCLSNPRRRCLTPLRRRIECRVRKPARILIAVVRLPVRAKSIDCSCRPNRCRLCPFPLPPAANRGA